jgi:hypothetical protein
VLFAGVILPACAGDGQQASSEATGDMDVDVSPKTWMSEATGTVAQAAQPSRESFSTVTEAGVTLQWRVQGDRLNVVLSAATTGWVAVGFKPGNGMKNADFLIGYVDGSGAKIRDDFGVSAIAHRDDESLGGKSDIQDPQGSEQGGRTELRFSIPLRSGDRYDQPLAAGEEVRILLAHGPSGADNYNAYHASRGDARIRL